MSLFKGLGRWYWGWIGFLTGPALGAIAIYLWLRGIAVRDWVFLLLIVVLALGEVFIFSYIRHNEKKGESLAKLPEAPKPTKEILLVLGLLADRVNGYSPRPELLAKYDETYEEQEADEFTAVIGELRGSGLIKDAPFPTNQEGIFITDEGSKYYRKHKERPKKGGKR